MHLGTSVYVDDYEINKDGADEEHRVLYEPVPGLADEYPVIGACVEGANRRRGRVIKGWMDRLGEALTTG